MKKILTILWFFLLAFVLLFVPRIGTWVANLFDYRAFDPDGSFLWISVHHMVQAVVVLILMIFFSRIFKLNFHLTLKNKEIGIRYLKRFMLFFTLYTVIAFTIIVIVGGFQSFAYPLTFRNIAGYLSFQLLLSGPSEELIFRAFAITLFVAFISNKRIHKHLSFANLFAALIFGIAHIGFSFFPFSATYSIQQVLFATALGLFYGDCYEKTDSIIYPMIMHSFGNVLMIGITVLLSFIL